MTLADRVAIVTGAGNGIGRATALALGRAGADVAAVDIDKAAAEKTAGAVSAAGRRGLAVATDVGDVAAIDQMVGRVAQAFGRIDVLVNNAGYGLLAAVEEATSEEVERQFQTNVFGLLKVTRAVLPHLRRAGKGHVINISAIVGYASFPGWGVYGASKFAVEGLTESLAMELAPLGIFATAVEPGFIRTNFLDGGSLKRTKNVIGAYADTVGAMREFATSVNHHQPGDPKKLAKAVLKLADSAKPPVRLPLGADTVAKIEEKNRFVEAELAQWRSVALSTNHDDVVTTN